MQNTYTNADKLLEAAEQLAQTGECDPEEIYQAAHQLEDRIQDFVRRVEQRKVLLDMSVAFHTHVKEVCRSSFLTIITIIRQFPPLQARSRLLRLRYYQSGAKAEDIDLLMCLLLSIKSSFGLLSS